MIVSYTVVLSVGLSDVGKKQLGDIDKQLMKAIDYRFGKQLGLSYEVLTMQERHLGIPEGATHYTSNILEDPTWYKFMKIGTVGDHWFRWNEFTEKETNY